MSKTLNKEKIRCPVGFLEEIKQFVLKKCIKFVPKLTKHLKIQIFETFMQFLCTFRKTWWLRMFSKDQIRSRGCFFEEIKAIGVKKMDQSLTEVDKKTILQFLCTFGKPWWLRNSKTFNKEQIGCQEGLLMK